MIQIDLKNNLEKQGFVNISDNTVTADCMLKKVDEEAWYCGIIKNVGINDISPEAIQNTTQEIERKLYLTEGARRVDIMHIIITDKGYDVSKLEKTGLKFWIVDINMNRLMIYENQPEEFLGLKNVVETSMAEARNTENMAKSQQSGNYENNYNSSTRSNSSYRNGNTTKINLNSIPIVTIVLISINIIIFALTEILGSSEDIGFMIKMGADNYELVFQNHEFYRLITSMFLHFGYEHLINNMFMLGVLGYSIEKKVGSLKFLIIYMVSGLASSICSTIYHSLIMDNSVSAGASGAIYGIFGVMILMMLFNKTDRNRYGMGRIIFVIFLLVYGSFGSNVDFAAHIGGMIAGIILALLCINIKGKRRM